jgi:hypothetical protein
MSQREQSNQIGARYRSQTAQEKARSMRWCRKGGKRQSIQPYLIILASLNVAAPLQTEFVGGDQQADVSRRAQKP